MTITSSAINVWTTPTPEYLTTKYLYQPMNEHTLTCINSDLNTTYSNYSTGIDYANVTCTADTTYRQWASYDYENCGIIINNGTSWCYPDTKKIEFQAKIKSNLVIHVKSRAPDIRQISVNEQVAMDTLREVVTESEFRRYLKYGFVLVKGKSGDTYQVFRNKSHTMVWRNGKVIEEICVRLKDGQIPATDNVIAFKTMIETDEVSFKKCGNVYKMKAA